jgi:predicted transcriptional regulator/ABC-type transporter Mla subunit MlaD
MERGLLSIARTTGLFGENLIRAAKASQQFMEYMRASGTFTAKAANNIIGLMAEAEKRGVSKGVGNLLEVLQGSLLGTQGGEGAKRLAMMGIGGSERVRMRLMTGTILQDRGAQRILAENLGRRLNEIARQRFGKAFDELSIEQKGILDPMIRSLTEGQFGVEELNQVIQTFRERGKDFTERMAELNQGTKRGLDETEVQNQRRQLIFDTGAEILDDFNRALKEEGGNLERAFAKIRRNSEDLAPFMKEFGIDINRGGNSIGEILKKQAEMIRKRAEDQGLTADVEKALGTPKELEARIAQAMADLQRGDRTNFDNLMQTMAKIEGKTREQMRQNADPATKMVTLLFKMEAHLRILMRTVLNEIAPQVQGWMLEFDKVLDKAAVEFNKGTPEGRQNAIKIIGEAMEKLPAEFSKTSRQIAGMRGSEGQRPGVIARGFAGGLEGLFGEDSLIGTIINKLGKMIKENAEKIEKAIKGVEDAINKLNENIQGIMKVIGQWAGVLAVGGVLAVAIGGIIALIVGGGGLVAVLGIAAKAIGALVAALGPLGLGAAATAGYVVYKAEQTKKEIKEGRKAVDAAVETHKKKTQEWLDEKQKTVGRMSDEELRKNIAETNKEIRHLSDTANYMSAEMQKNITSWRNIASPTNLLGTADVAADETLAAANKITEAQNETRRKLEMLQKELLRRTTEGKGSDEIAQEIQKAQQRAAAAQKAQGEMWNRLNEATGGVNWTVDEVRKNEHKLNAIARVTGKTRDEIYDIINKHYSRFGTSDDYEARMDINRLISRSEPYQQKQAEFQTETRKAMGASEMLKKSYEAEKKSKKDYFMSQFGNVQDEKAKRILENYIDRFLEVQMSASKELKVGDLKDAGQFRAPDELKDPEKYRKWRTEMEAFQAKLKELTGTTINLNEVNKKMIEQNTKMRTADQAASDAAVQIFKGSKDVVRPELGMKTYETTLGEKIVAKDYKTATEQAAKLGQKIEDRTKTEARLMKSGLIARDEKGQFKRSDADFEKYAATLASKITEKQVQEFDVTKQLLAEKDPEKQAKMYEVLHKKLLESINWDKMSWEDYEKAITQLATLEKAQQMLMQKATTPGSIYTHDLHLEKLLEGSPLIAPPSKAVLAPGMAKEGGPTIIPLLPNAGTKAEEEIKRRKAEVQNAGRDSMGGIEANTGSTAANTRAMARMLAQIGKILAKRSRKPDLDVAGPDHPVEAFFEEILNTEWPNARIGRKVGLEFDYTDLS